MDTLASLPLLFQPGTQWRYSMSTDVCGYLVELISGMPFADYMQENICNQLNMSDTSFMIPADKQDRFSELYSHDEDGNLIPLEAGTFRIRDYTSSTPSPSGGAGLLSTMPDYVNLCIMLLNKGHFNGQQILGQKTVEFMMCNHVSPDILPLSIGDTVYNGFGFGLMSPIMLDIGQAGFIGSDGEYSWTTAGDTYFWIDPQEDMFGLFMTQYLPTGHQPRPDARQIFRTLVYQALIN
jgi:CubicO group peptidase (beta-lactamase class C family)